MHHFKQQRLLWRGLLAIIIILAFSATYSQLQLHGYVSAGTLRFVSGLAEGIQPHDNLSTATAVLPLKNVVVTATFTYAFVKFDRKQNTRLWPFITAGTTRSPPLSI
jgi:hypothetical protein